MQSAATDSIGINQYQQNLMVDTVTLASSRDKAPGDSGSRSLQLRATSQRSCNNSSAKLSPSSADAIRCYRFHRNQPIPSEPHGGYRSRSLQLRATSQRS
ncbi:MAG: hypothetical protein AAFR61_21730 [Bacteroidota bacterium]